MLSVALVDDANTLRQLKFPKGSRVTQSPMEHVSDFLKMFDTENDWSESNSANFSVDWVVTMDEYTFSIPGMGAPYHYTHLSSQVW